MTKLLTPDTKQRKNNQILRRRFMKSGSKIYCVVWNILISIVKISRTLVIKTIILYDKM